MRARPLLALVPLLLAGCPKAPEAVAPPAPPPPLPKVPPGCEASLSGNYHHQDDETFRYALTDDGTTVHVRVSRQFGSTNEPIGNDAAAFDLRRTPSGLRGAAHATVRTLSGARSCPVEFPYEVTACSPAALTLRTLQQAMVNEDCTLEDPHPGDLVLVRDAAPDAGPPQATDAGLPEAAPSPDAGPTDAGMPAPAADAGDAGAPAPLPDAGEILHI